MDHFIMFPTKSSELNHVPILPAYQSSIPVALSGGDHVQVALLLSASYVVCLQFSPPAA
jgi:hypothetical protein